MKSAKIVGPAIIGVTAFLISSSLLLKTKLSEMIGVSELQHILLISTIASLVVTMFGIVLLRKIEAKSTEDYATVESIFRKLKIITSCYVADRR